ncbi:MAG TPA: M23 family metallopeptidase [Epsilonproteobacteria bacterium]|nr:M23 family metallopeptidase [Campylobacterota bacterium]
MKVILWTILMVSFAFGAKMSNHVWERGETFSGYLDQYGITQQVLGKVSKEDEKYLMEMQSGARYYELKDDGGHLVQSLIPLNKELQVHLFREANGAYGYDITPIEYRVDEYYVRFELTSNPYSDTLKAVDNPQVAQRLSEVLKGNIDTRKLRLGDTISFIYHQKTRLDALYAMPDIKVVSLESRGKTDFFFADEDGDGHPEAAKKAHYTADGDFERKVRLRDRTRQLGMPLRHVRITSHFTYRRWHPILKRYRPHHGTDFGARKGTPLLAVYSGKITYAGWMGGYGKVVKIRHPQGYESLYAHQSRIAVHKGQYVKKGEIIGYVGNTGRSTGPHLHFGLKRNGRWINPMKVLRKATLDKKIRYKKIVIKDAKSYKDRLLSYSESGTTVALLNGEENKRKTPSAKS